METRLFEKRTTFLSSIEPIVFKRSFEKSGQRLREEEQHGRDINRLVMLIIITLSLQVTLFALLWKMLGV